MDSLPYRNDAAIVFRRLIRSLPRRKGVLGIATCDKGLPAMMMALAGSKHLAGVLVPGGVTLPPARGRRRRQDPVDRRPLSPRRAHAGRGRRAGLPGLRQPRRRLPVPGDGRHVAGRRRGARHHAAARRAGPVRPADLARHGPPLGPRTGRASRRRGSTLADMLTDAADPQRHGRPRRVRRLDEPAAPHPGHRLRRRTATPDGRRLARDQRQGPPAGQRPAQRAVLSPDRARLSSPAACPRSCSTCGSLDLLDLSVADRHRRAARARARRGGRRASGASGCASGCSSRTASIPTT